MQYSLQFNWKHFYKASTLPSYYWEYKVGIWERRSLDKLCSSINTSGIISPTNLVTLSCLINVIWGSLPAIYSILPLWEKLPHQSWSHMAWQFNKGPHHSQVNIQLLSLTSSCMQYLTVQWTWPDTHVVRWWLAYIWRWPNGAHSEINLLESCLLCRIQCCNILIMCFTMVAFGLSQTCQICHYPVLMTLHGRRWRSNGSQCGCQCQNFLRHASCWWNVVQNNLLKQQVHKLMCSAHYCANANVGKRGEGHCDPCGTLITWLFSPKASS